MVEREKVRWTPFCVTRGGGLAWEQGKQKTRGNVITYGEYPQGGRAPNLERGKGYRYATRHFVQLLTFREYIYIYISPSLGFLEASLAIFFFPLTSFSVAH